MVIKNYTKSTPAANYRAGRNGQKIGLIVLHIGEGSFSSLINTFLNPKNEVSAHFVISKTGEVAQMVALTDTAYCNGTETNAAAKRYYKNATNPIVKARAINANYYSATIEFEGYASGGKCTMTQAAEAAAVEVIQYIIKESKRIYGNDIPIDRTRICGHYEVTPQWKPFCGNGFPYDRIIQSVKK